MNDDDSNTQEQLRSLLRSADESRIRSRYTANPASSTGSFEGRRFGSSSATNPNDYTLSEKKVNELADLIGTIEGSTYSTDKLRSSRSFPSSSLNSRSATGLPATYRPGGRSSEITPPSLERNMPLRTSASYDKGDRDSVRRSIDLEDEESVRESQGRGMTNDRSQPTARSYQPPPARDSDNQSYSYSRSATTVTSSTNGDGAAGGGKEQDQSDFTVIRFQQNYVIRGKHGKYLTALPEELGPSPQLSSSLPEQSPNAKAFEMSRSPVPPSRTYLLGAEGQGIGELMDCLTFVPVDNKEPQHSEVKYGSVVAIKSSYSKERLLGLRDGTKLGFWRHVVGQGEKWVILKANQSVTHSVVNSNTSLSGIIPSHQLNLEDVSARGKYVRVGDTILIQCYKSDHCLSLVEVATTFASSYVSGNPNTVASGPGYEIRLQLKDRSGLGSEVWQIEVFGTVPLPTWCQSRPFLSGKYLVMPASLRAPPPEVESRVFPRASNMSTFMQNIHSNLHPLHDYEVEEQQHILMREILLLLSGIEGNYIRIAAAVKSFSQDQANKDFDDAAVEEEMRKYRDGGGGLKEFHNALNQRMTAPPSITLPSIDSIKLVIDVDSADRSLATQVTQLLTMCEQSLKIRHFLRQQSRYEYGYVSHAFCASIKSILHDFDVIICQLEYLLNAEKLSIQKFIFLLQQSKTTLQLLDKMIASVKELNGGQLLNELYSQYQQQGDSNAKQLYEYLLEKAFEPFINILSIWIFRGELEDPYHEFMIQEDITVTKEALQEDLNAQYWDNRYTLQSSHIPTIFQPYSQKILNTGKYLNVIRDCIGDYAFLTESSSSSSSHNTSSVVVAGKRENSSFFYRNKENQSPHVPHHPMEKFLQFSQQYSSQHRHKKGSGRMTSETSSGAVFSIMNAQSCRSLFEAVEVAYQYSSQSLLQLLLNGYSLRSHFESLGKFFLLQHGDFFIQFMDIAEQDLRKEVKDITIVRLNHLLQLAIQTSTLASDDHKDLISCTLASHNLIQHLHLIQTAGETATVSTMSDAIYASLSTQGLKGIEAFTLDYHVTWPLSILLSRRILTKYQLLSRLLYFSKHVERRLLTSWISLQVCKEIPLLRELLMESYTLRHRMLHFIQNFVYYITFEVIHPRNHEFEEEFAVALGSKDINEIMELHERFLDNCLKECLLASSDLLKILTKIMTTCLLFADHLVKLFNEIDEHYQKKEEFYLSQLKASAQQPASGRSPSVSKSQSNDQTANKTGGKEGGVKGRDRLQKAVVQRQWKIVNYSELLFQEIKHDSFHRILHKFINTFDQQLKEFLETLWTDSNRHHMQLSNLCVRLDYNGFYSSIFVEKDNTMFSTSNNNNTTGQGKPQT